MLGRLFADRQRLFWTLQILGWGGYAVAAWLGALAHEKPESYMRVIAATAAVGFGLTTCMRVPFHHLWQRHPLAIASFGILINYLAALAWKAFSNVIFWDWVKGGWVPDHWMTFFDGATGAFYVLLCWSGLYFGIKYYLELQQQIRDALEARATAHQAQLRMLRYQLNPHFLFNTLNAISTLILDSRNEEANRAVTRLSRFLRFTLNSDPTNKVPLSEELAAIDLYLRIEKVRFGERLQLRHAVETGVHDALLPSLILQPIIENAVKYAVAPREDGAEILIEARHIGPQLVIRIADTGPGLGHKTGQPTLSCGVGLANTKARLRQNYGEHQSFTIEPNHPRGVRVTMKMPFEHGDHQHDKLAN